MTRRNQFFVISTLSIRQTILFLNHTQWSTLMALQGTYETVHGIVLGSAFVRVSHFNGNKDQTEFSALIYADKKAADEGKTFVEQKMYSMPTENSMSMTTLYGYLKSQPEFENMVDV